MATRPDQTCWFAAHTRCGAELGVRERLGRLGTEHFLPTELRSRTRGRAPVVWLLMGLSINPA